MLTLAAVTGRFQPLHCGHWELLTLALAEADRVFIGITNPDPASWSAHPSSVHRHQPQSNPFTYWERLQMIQSALDHMGLQSRCPIVPFPLDRPAVWTNYIPQDAMQFVRVFSEWERDKAQLLQSGGYAVRLLDGDPNNVVRATEIREALARGDEASWQSLVPDGVASAMPAWAVPK